MNPQTIEELMKFIQAKIDGVEWPSRDDPNRGSLADSDSAVTRGYQQSADALWETAEAVFNFVAREVGASGFQAGWAAMQLFGKIQGIEGPWGFVRASDMVYPQTADLAGKVAKWQEEWAGWVSEEAKKKLAKEDEYYGPLRAHPNVIAHWKELANV